MRGDEGMVESERYNCITVLGATATGKTSLAVALAKRFGGEILSAENRQVYRGLDIGSGKDLAEYGTIPCHLIDITGLETEYSVFDYQQDFYREFASLLERDALPVISGGTGMYLDSILRSYRFERVPENPVLRAELESCSMTELEFRLRRLKEYIHNTTDLETRERLVRAIEIAEHNADKKDACVPPTDVRSLVIGIRFERTELRSRIEKRLDARIAEGLVAEVEGLHSQGYSWERLERLGLEYRLTAELLQKKIPDAITWRDTLFREICRFAKRQETWFRGMERKGVEIHWIERGDPEAAFSLAESTLVR